MKVFNKLVRDKIPYIIAENGEKAIIHKLNDQDYIKELDIKLQEEVNEYLADGNVEELADIVEVIYGLLDAKCVTLDDFENMRKAKADKRGAFKERIFLECTLEE